MNEKIFINSNLSNWKSLENSLNSFKKNRYKHDKGEIDKLLSLYSVALENLSFARTNYPDSDINIYLNELTLRAHNNIYQNQAIRKKNFIVRAISTFKDSFLRYKYYILSAFIAFLIGGIAAYVLCMINPDNIYAFLPRNIVHSININGPKSVDSPGMSSSIMINNIKVAFTAFVLGVALCLLTFYVLFQNGAIIGALIAYVKLNHQSMLSFISLILPHGVIELLAIFISGGTGMMIGYAFINPGKYKRLDALRLKARESMPMLGGVVVMLIIAGTIEGFITPSHIPPQAKVAIGLVTLFASFVFFFPWNTFTKQPSGSSIQ